jgi:hypothetical protein
LLLFAAVIASRRVQWLTLLVSEVVSTTSAALGAARAISVGKANRKIPASATTQLASKISMAKLARNFVLIFFSLPDGNRNTANPPGSVKKRLDARAPGRYQTMS